MSKARRLFNRGSVGCLTLIGIFFVLGLALPRTWHVERSVVIAAPPELIHPFVEDFAEWQKWAHWQDARDGDGVRRTHSTPSSGVGAQTTWTGSSMGEGMMRIVESDEAVGIKLEEAIDSNGEINAYGSIAYEVQQDGSTRVTWTDAGTAPRVIGPYFIWLIHSTLTEHFDGALRNLKRIAEQEQKERTGK